MIIQSPRETRHHLNGETLPHVGAPDDIDPISECQKTDSSCFHNFSDLIRLLPVVVNPAAHADAHTQQEAATDPTQTGTKLPLQSARTSKSKIVRNRPTQLLLSHRSRASIDRYLYRGLAHTPNVVDPTRITKKGASLFGHGACRFVRTSHPGQKVPTLKVHGSQQIALYHFGGGIFMRRPL